MAYFWLGSARFPLRSWKLFWDFTFFSATTLCFLRIHFSLLFSRINNAAFSCVAWGMHKKWDFVLLEAFAIVASRQHENQPKFYFFLIVCFSKTSWVSRGKNINRDYGYNQARKLWIKGEKSHFKNVQIFHYLKAY